MSHLGTTASCSVVVFVVVRKGPGSKTVEVQEDPTKLKDGVLSCGLDGTNAELCNAIASALLGLEYQGVVVEVALLHCTCKKVRDRLDRSKK